MYYKILSNKDLFHKYRNYIKISELLEIIISNDKPKLSSNCKELFQLINKCQALDSSKRPSFENICKRINVLKKKSLVEIDTTKKPRGF